MAELLALRYRQTGRSLPSAPTQSLPRDADAGTYTVPWGTKIHVSLAPPLPDPPVLHCWGVGPSCGGLATSQPQPLGEGFYEWVIGTEPDIVACHAAGINECWLTNPSLYIDPPANFGRWLSQHTSRTEIAEVIPPEARLARLYAPIPSMPTVSTFATTPPPDLPAIFGLDMRRPLVPTTSSNS